jgi:hypothetical protein
MDQPGLTRLPSAFAETRDALHRLAVYVISPAQRLVNGEIILRATPGGFGTAALPGRTIRVEGTELVDEAGGEIRRAPIASLHQAAAFLGIEPDVSQQEAFDVPPHGDLDAALGIDAGAAAALAAWYAFTTSVLDELRTEPGGAEDVSPVRLWPEHFDAAIDMGEHATGGPATYGSSPGDAAHPEPYLYVSPWAGRIDPFFDDPHFQGASLGYADLLAGADARAFLRGARRRITPAS